MSEMSPELKAKYFDEAVKHAEFLTEKVWKPAFIIAYIHGVKHGREDIEKEELIRELTFLKKEKMKNELNAGVKRKKK